MFLASIACYSGHSHLEVKNKCARNFITADNIVPANCFRYNNLPIFLTEPLFSNIQEHFLLKMYFFRLRHFAGTVNYTVEGFVDKNRDFLSRDLSQAMYSSNHSLLKTLFPEGNPKRVAIKSPATVGTQFKISLSALLRTLTTKQPHYIRCIKPNELKQPRIFETALIQHQIRYLWYCIKS